MLRLMCESSAVWVLVEERICRIPEEGTRTQDGLITLCAAFQCWPGSQGLVSTIRAFRFTLLYGRARTISFTAFITWFLCIEKYLKELESFLKCYLVILKPVGVSVSPR